MNPRLLHLPHTTSPATTTTTTSALSLSLAIGNLHPLPLPHPHNPPSSFSLSLSLACNFPLFQTEQRSFSPAEPITNRATKPLLLPRLPRRRGRERRRQRVLLGQARRPRLPHGVLVFSNFFGVLSNFSRCPRLQHRYLVFLGHESSPATLATPDTSLHRIQGSRTALQLVLLLPASSDMPFSSQAALLPAVPLRSWLLNCQPPHPSASFLDDESCSSSPPPLLQREPKLLVPSTDLLGSVHSAADLLGFSKKVDVPSAAHGQLRRGLGLARRREVEDDSRVELPCWA